MRQLGKGLTVSCYLQLHGDYFLGENPAVLQGVARFCAFFGWFFVVKTW